MKKILLMTTVLAAGRLPVAFANTNSGGKIYISHDGANNPLVADTVLNQTAFEALQWLEVKNMGSFGETGPNTNIATYDTWDNDVAQKGAGITNAGDPEVEFARAPTDLGQIAMRSAAQPSNRGSNYAFKLERIDGTIFYNRGLCLGPRHPNGRNEDFVLEVFTIGCNQLEVVVEPA